VRYYPTTGTAGFPEGSLDRPYLGTGRCAEHPEPHLPSTKNLTQRCLSARSTVPPRTAFQRVRHISASPSTPNQTHRTSQTSISISFGGTLSKGSMVRNAPYSKTGRLECSTWRSDGQCVECLGEEVQTSGRRVLRSFWVGFARKFLYGKMHLTPHNCVKFFGNVVWGSIHSFPTRLWVGYPGLVSSDMRGYPTCSGY
jgi:hypothetical protein